MLHIRNNLKARPICIYIYIYNIYNINIIYIYIYIYIYINVYIYIIYIYIYIIYIYIYIYIYIEFFYELHVTSTVLSLTVRASAKLRHMAFTDFYIYHRIAPSRKLYAVIFIFFKGLIFKMLISQKWYELAQKICNVAFIFRYKFL